MAKATLDMIKQLATRYEAACEALNAAVPHSSASESEFFQIIHRPGWTSLVDVQHATDVLEVFEQQAKTVSMTSKALVRGAHSALGKAD
jgi:hypothetical protein